MIKRRDPCAVKRFTGFFRAAPVSNVWALLGRWGVFAFPRSQLSVVLVVSDALSLISVSLW